MINTLLWPPGTTPFGGPKYCREEFTQPQGPWVEGSVRPRAAGVLSLPAARVEPRRNQAGLIRGLRDVGSSLIIVGALNPDHGRCTEPDDVDSVRTAGAQACSAPSSQRALAMAGRGPQLKTSL